MAAKIRKNDEVVVLTGRDKGKKGKVLRVIPAQNRAVVEGINIVTKHQKPSMESAGGIVKKEAPIQLSNLAVVDPKSGDATKVGFKLEEGGKKIRFAKKSGEVLDN